MRRKRTVVPFSGLGIILIVSVWAGYSLGWQQSGQPSVKSGQWDGPAELPRAYVRSSLADSPAPGRVILVRAGDNLQEVLNKASCGDVIKLEAGATFRGTFSLPDHHCDSARWIIVRTSASDESLPPEGTRATPCAAGIASLPGRPDFPCASPHNVMAKLEFDGNGGSGPLHFPHGSSYYRLLGLEITRGESRASVFSLAIAEEGAGAHHIIFDRVWMHGSSQTETKAGVHLTDMTNVAIVDSYFSDFHCIAMVGACTDAQAVNGGTGDAPGGAYKITNNFLEASGENIMFGGGPATTTPADIEIRRNHLFKPLQWKPGQTGFVGGPSGNAFIVKNHFELKNAERVLFEGNILENCWGGFSQTGFSILLTPKSQSNACPLCRVTDITVRHNIVRHVASVLQIANDLSGKGGAASAGERYSIHDLVADDVDGDAYHGFGLFATFISVAPPLRDIRIDHVTAFPNRALLTIISGEQPRMERVTITNSIFTAGMREIASAGGGPRNCAYQRGPADIWKSCFDDSSFSHNLVIGAGGGWPKDNWTVRSAGDAGIRDFRQGRGGDYRLCQDAAEPCKKASRALHAASDGRDLGADLDEIEKATAGVL